jgi:hypothetical protein
MSKVKMIKKDAQITITVGTSFISDVQGILLSLLSDKTEEDINRFKVAMESFKNDQADFTEEWMKHVHVITTLLGEIQDVAEKTNQIVEKDLDDLLSNELES